MISGHCRYADQIRGLRQQRVQRIGILEGHAKRALFGQGALLETPDAVLKLEIPDRHDALEVVLRAAGTEYASPSGDEPKQSVPDIADPERAVFHLVGDGRIQLVEINAGLLRGVGDGRTDSRAWCKIADEERHHQRRCGIGRVAAAARERHALEQQAIVHLGVHDRDIGRVPEDIGVGLGIGDAHRLRIALGVHAIDAVAVDFAALREVDDDVAADAADRHAVRSFARDDHVIAGAAVDPVFPRTAENQIVALGAGDVLVFFIADIDIDMRVVAAQRPRLVFAIRDLERAAAFIRGGDIEAVENIRGGGTPAQLGEIFERVVVDLVGAEQPAEEFVIDDAIGHRRLAQEGGAEIGEPDRIDLGTERVFPHHARHIDRQHLSVFGK